MWAHLSMCLCSAALAADPLGPGAGLWEVETPEAHGLSTVGLQVAKDYLFDKSAHDVRGQTHRDCFMVIKDGALVFEEYSSDTYNHTVHQGYSMTKTLGALIAGHSATHLGLDIDADITEVYGVRSPKRYPVTSRQIMSQALAGKDAPGENWEYDAVGIEWINHMARVVPAATGKKPSDIWQQNFTEPLGFDSLTFDTSDSVWATGSKGTCRDYARLGQLMLNKGHWKDVEKPIVGEDFIHELSTPQTRYGDYANYSNPCYGLLTWLTTVGKQGDEFPGICKTPDGQLDIPGARFPVGSPNDVFLAAGMFGQIVMVLPSHNAVVVSMGFNLNQQLVPVWIYNALCIGKVFEECTLNNIDVDVEVVV